MDTEKGEKAGEGGNKIVTFLKESYAFAQRKKNVSQFRRDNYVRYWLIKNKNVSHCKDQNNLYIY